MSLNEDYGARFAEVLPHLAMALEEQLKAYLEGEERIDRVQARAKSVDRFLAKAAKQQGGTAKYPEPLHQIQDQVGARIVSFYVSDIERISRIVERYFRPVEAKNLIPESEWEFGYFGRHYVLLIPDDLVDPSWDRRHVPEFFELQVKTLFQHAWSEANHDLGYKPGGRELSSDSKRRMAFTSAQAWGADQIFEELFRASEATI
jgi:ppGpp synthetase/RelA/SpoT-type nucleotidyltranferase